MDAKRVAVVTGAGGGMGLGIARQLAADGLRVYGLDVQDKLLGDSFGTLSAEGLDVHPLTLDIADENSVASLPDRLGEDFSRLGVLVNNAAISPKRGRKRAPFTELSLEDWDAVIRVNLTGAFLMSRVCLPPMLAAGWGRVINNSSVGGKTVIGIAVASYNTSKAGLLGLTRALAREVASAGVTVNAICPGRIDTPMMAGAAPETNADLLARTPIGRFGTPEDIGHLVAFLASEKSGFITGASMDINGGMVML
jgi:3-oxoacyl-[acyl-carrier protein] reductase